MKIKRCPFCGHKAVAVQNEYGKWSVMCDGCFAEVMDVYGNSKKGAINCWNRRYKKR